MRMIENTDGELIPDEPAIGWAITEQDVEEERQYREEMARIEDAEDAMIALWLGELSGPHEDNSGTDLGNGGPLYEFGGEA